jgi:hypothetical protein
MDWRWPPFTSLFVSVIHGRWLHDTALYYWGNVQVWGMAALQVAYGKGLEFILCVQVWFNFVQVWGAERATKMHKRLNRRRQRAQRNADGCNHGKHGTGFPSPPLDGCPKFLKPLSGTWSRKRKEGNGLKKRVQGGCITASCRSYETSFLSALHLPFAAAVGEVRR